MSVFVIDVAEFTRHRVSEKVMTNHVEALVSRDGDSRWMGRGQLASDAVVDAIGPRGNLVAAVEVGRLDDRGGICGRGLHRPKGIQASLGRVYGGRIVDSRRSLDQTVVQIADEVAANRLGRIG